MFDPGSILLIKNYTFNNGEFKDKFCIVLHADDKTSIIIHCLTTSKNKFGVSNQNFGCSIHDGIPYFCFPAFYEIERSQDFYFEKDTLVFFKDNIREKEISELQSSDVILKCKLSKKTLKRIIKCILKSRYTPQRLAKVLELVKVDL